MKRTILAILSALIVITASAKDSAAAGTIEGQPVINAGYLNCLVENDYNFDVKVKSISYEFACQEVFYPYRTIGYVQKVSCGFNCKVEASDSQLFTGPSGFNCNIVAAECKVRAERIESSDEDDFSDY